MSTPNEGNGRPVLGTTKYHRVPMSFFLQPGFGKMLKRCRERRKIGVRIAAKESRVTATTWSRVELGGDTMVTTAIQLSIWMIEKGLLDEVYSES